MPDRPWHNSDTFDSIHIWFGLSYANYLVYPRSLLQSMPDEWQRQFVKLLADLEHAAEAAELPMAFQYEVQTLDSSGKPVKDQVPYYERGRRDVLTDKIREEIERYL